MYVRVKISSGCVLCGYSKCVAALQFHHTGDDKSFELSKNGGKGLSMQSVRDEISNKISAKNTIERGFSI